MTDPVWKIPTSELVVDTVNDWAARFLANHSLTMPSDIEVETSDYAIKVFDHDDTSENLTIIRRPGYNGPINVTTFPWDDSFYAQLPGGTDKNAIIINHTDGRQWGIWAALPPFYFGPTKYLAVGAAYLIKGPDGSVADYRTYLGNMKGATGSGYQVRPVLESELDAELIEHWIPMSYSNAMRGATGYANSPAGQFEQAGNPEPVPNWNEDIAIPEGTRLGLDPAVVTDPFIEDWLDDRGLTGVDRSRARTIAVAMRDYGIFLQLTGPKAAVLCDVIDGVPDDLMDGLLTEDTLVAYETPVSTLLGGATTTRHGWAMSIEYDGVPDEEEPDPPIEATLVGDLQLDTPVRLGQPWSASGTLTVEDITAEDVTVVLTVLSEGLGTTVDLTGDFVLADLDGTPQSLGDIPVGTYEFTVGGNSYVTGAGGDPALVTLTFAASNAIDESPGDVENLVIHPNWSATATYIATYGGLGPAYFSNTKIRVVSVPSGTSGVRLDYSFTNGIEGEFEDVAPGEYAIGTFPMTSSPVSGTIIMSGNYLIGGGGPIVYASELSTYTTENYPTGWNDVVGDEMAVVGIKNGLIWTPDMSYAEVLAQSEFGLFGGSIQNPTDTSWVADGDDVLAASVFADGDLEALIIYRQDFDAPPNDEDELAVICIIALAAPVPLTTADTVEIQWDNGANKIFTYAGAFGTPTIVVT